MKMKKFGNLEVRKTQKVWLGGRLTNVYECWEIDGNSRIFDGRFTAKTYKEAYEKYLGI